MFATDNGLYFFKSRYGIIVPEYVGIPARHYNRNPAIIRLNDHDSRFALLRQKNQELTVQNIDQGGKSGAGRINHICLESEQTVVIELNDDSVLRADIEVLGHLVNLTSPPLLKLWSDRYQLLTQRRGTNAFNVERVVIRDLRHLRAEPKYWGIESDLYIGKVPDNLSDASQLLEIAGGNQIVLTYMTTDLMVGHDKSAILLPVMEDPADLLRLIKRIQHQFEFVPPSLDTIQYARAWFGAYRYQP